MEETNLSKTERLLRLFTDVRPGEGPIAVMMFAARPVGEFIEKHPTTKMLALSFLLLIGAALIADGFHFHIPREYIYFAIAFSLGVEVLNLLAGRNRQNNNSG